MVNFRRVFQALIRFAFGGEYFRLLILGRRLRWLNQEKVITWWSAAAQDEDKLNYSFGQRLVDLKFR